MKVNVIEKHDGEGQFPTFSKGTLVSVKEACTHYRHWYACKIDTYFTYIPESYIVNGKLIQDYNPTELVQNVGDIVTVKAIVYGWLFAVNEDKKCGWIPAEKVVSIYE